MNGSRHDKANEQPMLRLDVLPDEIIQSIFQHLDAISVVDVALTAKRFLPIADEHLIWKAFCLRDFTHWDTSHEIESRTTDPSFQDWKGLYAVRYRAHTAAKTSLQGIIEHSVGRLGRIQSICDYGYGIKDTLLQLYQEALTSDAPLAQRYWTHTVFSCLNRARALEVWTRIRFRSNIENATELALAAIDLFNIGNSTAGDIDDTFRRLDRYVDAVRAAYPDIETKSPRTRAVTIAAFLRAKKWVGIQEGGDYYSIENQFLGYALRSQHRNSLPLISAVIYSYVCRALGLRAQPCSYPNHIYVVVQPLDRETDLDGNSLPSNHPRDAEESSDDSNTPNTTANQPNRLFPSELTHLYMDPFNTYESIPIAYLASQLNFVHPTASDTQRINCLHPAAPRALLLRTAHNILRSINTSVPPARQRNRTTYFTDLATNNDDTDIPPIPEINDAAYAALFILVLFPSTPASLAANLAELRQHFAGNFPEDLNNYIRYINPLTAGGLGNFAGRGDHLINHFREEDMEIKTPKLRAGIEGGDEVKYKVGTVFRHKRQGYTAVIYGWDVKCEMNERWIMGNNVDGLAGGRGQPFYNSFVDDRSSRYVAQENIITLGPEEFTERDVDGTFGIEVGKWFRKFDVVNGGFVSNVLDEYPEG